MNGNEYFYLAHATEMNLEEAAINVESPEPEDAILRSGYHNSWIKVFVIIFWLENNEFERFHA